MKKIAFLLFVSLLAFAACKQDKTSGQEGQQENATANPTDMTGHWIAIDFCSRAGQFGSVLSAINNSHRPYAYAFFIDGENPDSIKCYNGEKEWALEANYNVDTIEMKNAANNMSIFLMYDSQGEQGMTMFDGTGKRTRTTQYIKSKSGAQTAYFAFATALNHNLFQGFYTLPGAPKDTIQFTSSGHITNFGPYDRYRVCAENDCFVAGSEIDVITMANTKDKDSLKKFGFRFNTQLDQLSIHKLTPDPEDPDAVYKVGPAIYTFNRIKPE